MAVTLRQARREDARQMRQLYNSLTEQFVGLASRTTKPFTRMLRTKDNITWVAVDIQGKVIGYVYARVDKRTNRGEFAEIVMDPQLDFAQTAKPLVEKVNAIFGEKKVSAVAAGSIRNPAYEKLFPEWGFYESESNDVFMYGILDVQKFLIEISPVFVKRLKQLDWNGLVEVQCEGHSLFLSKTGERVEQIVWTNQPVNFKVTLTRELLTRLIFGTVDAVESHRIDELRVETSEISEKTKQLLGTLFPRRQFLIMDYW
jgi:N-acetylglutamate synthase-like GNAT family acetyltransferase